MSESNKSLTEILAPVQKLKDKVLLCEQEYEVAKEAMSEFWKPYTKLNGAKKSAKAALEAARVELAKECAKHKDLMDLLKSMK